MMEIMEMIFSGFQMSHIIVVSLTYLYIAYMDYRTCYIWDLPIIISFLVNILYAFYNYRLLDCLLGGVIAGLIHGIIFLVTMYIYNEEKYGLGDVLLMSSIGTMLGVRNFLEYQFLEFIATGLLALILLLYKRENISIPLAPVYVFWLFVYIGLDKPEFFNWYCSLVTKLFNV